MSKQLSFLILGVAQVVGCGEETHSPTTGTRTFVDYPTREASTGLDAGAGPRSDAAWEQQRELNCGPRAPNRVSGGNFEYRPFHACGWESFDAADWGVTTAPYCYGSRDGCVAYLEAKVWGEAWVAQFYQDLWLEPRQEYIFLFEAKAAGAARPLTAAVLGVGPLDGLGAGITIELVPEWRIYHFPFQATDWGEESTVVFAFGAASNGLYLDNVAIVPVPPPSGDQKTDAEAPAN